MKNKWITCLLAVVLLLLCACGPEAAPVTDPPTTEPLTTPTTAPTTAPTAAPTTAPTTTPTTSPTTAPTTEPATEPVETDEPRQEGQRLTAAELEQYSRVFVVQGDSYARHPENYYTQALCFTFSDPRTIKLEEFFCDGFGSKWAVPLTEAEWDFVDANIGDRNLIGDIDRLPRNRVNEVLEYYFGLTVEDLDDDALHGLHYYEETDSYYNDPPGAIFYGRVEFIDGYYDEETDTISLYYMHRYKEREYVVTLQSKRSLKQYGYYILSNLPVE